MPGLSDLLDEAVGPVEPSFDVDDVTTRGLARRGRRRRRRTTAVVATAVGVGVVVASIAVTRTDGSRVRTTTPSPTAARTDQPSPATREQLRTALAAWATFPGDARPRPLLLVSESPIGASVTFDNQTKDAFDSGAFEQPTSFPDAPTQVDGRPIIGAADALADLRAQATPVAGPHPTPVPLKIATMRLDRAGFGTDRGVVSLPAWIFTFDGVQGAVPVLALAPAARFPTPRDLVQAPPSLSAQLAPDGSTVTVSFTGAAAGSGPCTADYTVDARSSRAAVAVSIQEHRNGTGAELCDLVGHARTATVTLARPLGGRVLVDAATKQAITVQP